MEGDIARLGGDAGSELLQIASEAMTNTIKHAQAKEVSISCRVNDEYGELQVSDDGVGFEPDHTPARGFGLRGMQERALRLNGQLVVTSKPAEGTQITVRIPLEITS